MLILEINRLTLIERLCCYIEQLEKIHIELNLRKNMGNPGEAARNLTKEFFCQILSDVNFVVDDLPKQPEQQPEIEVEPEPIHCVFGVYLVRQNGSRYRIFDKQVKAIDEMGTTYSLWDLCEPDTVLFPGDGKNTISYAQAICCLKHHFQTIKAYLSSIKGVI